MSANPIYSFGKLYKAVDIEREPLYPTMNKALWLKAVELVTIKKGSQQVTPAEVLRQYKALKVKDDKFAYLVNKIGVPEDALLEFMRHGTSRNEEFDKIIWNYVNQQTEGAKEIKKGMEENFTTSGPVDSYIPMRFLNRIVADIGSAARVEDSKLFINDSEVTIIKHNNGLLINGTIFGNPSIPLHYSIIKEQLSKLVK